MKLNNEKGGALLYVLMISMMIGIVVPTVLYIGSNSDLAVARSEKEKIINQLAVSGMQAIARYPGTLQDKLVFLRDNYYGETIVKLPDGLEIGYQQYVVNVDDEPEVANQVDRTLLDMNTSYKVVVRAYLGTLEKKLVSYMDLAGPIVTISPDNQTEGDVVPVTVTIETLNAIGETRSVVLDGPNSQSKDCTVDNNGFCMVTFNDLSAFHPFVYNVQILGNNGVSIIYNNPKTYIVVHAPITIETVSATPTSQNAQIVDVSVTTSGAPSNDYDRPVTFELVNESNLSSLSPAVIINTTFKGSDGDDVSIVWTIPDSVPAGSYRIKVTIPGASEHTTTEYDITSTSLGTITSNPTIHQAGYFQLIAVKVIPNGIPVGTWVDVEFIADNDNSVITTVSRQTKLNPDTGNIDADIPLMIEGTVPAGLYEIKVTIMGMTDSIPYTISASVPAAEDQGEAMTFVDGVKRTFSETSLIKDMQDDGKIETTGMLFIPASYDLNYGNDPINFIANEGIFIAGDVETISSRGDIVLSSCYGPVVIDGTTFEGGNKNSTLTIYANTYISAKDTNFKYFGINELVAKTTIDVTNSTFTFLNNQGSAILNASNKTSAIKDNPIFIIPSDAKYIRGVSTSNTCPKIATKEG
jgi:hypothetical protein